MENVSINYHLNYRLTLLFRTTKTHCAIHSQSCTDMINFLHSYKLIIIFTFYRLYSWFIEAFIHYINITHFLFWDKISSPNPIHSSRYITEPVTFNLVQKSKLQCTWRCLQMTLNWSSNFPTDNAPGVPAYNRGWITILQCLTKSLLRMVGILSVIRYPYTFNGDRGVAEMRDIRDQSAVPHPCKVV